MTDVVYTHAGVTVAISNAIQNTDLNEAGFAGLTYIPIANVGNIGEYGINTNMLSYDTLNTLVSRKAKGITNAGDPTIECARDDSDAGQQAMIAAGAPDSFDAYAFKVTRQDGSVDYLRGLVAGPNQPNGRNEDFDLYMFTLGLNQAPVHVAASA